MRPAVKTTAIAAVALTAGLGIGASGASGNITPPQVETRTVERTPAVCRAALDRAEVVMTTAGQAMAIMAEGFGAAADFDVARLNDVSSRLQAMQPKLRAARGAYDEAAAQCRGADV